MEFLQYRVTAEELSAAKSLYSTVIFSPLDPPVLQ